MKFNCVKCDKKKTNCGYWFTHKRKQICLRKLQEKWRKLRFYRPMSENTQKKLSKKMKGKYAGKKNWNWRGGKVKCICKCGCKKVFYITSARVKNEGNFYSSNCFGIWNSKNRRGKNSPQWRGGISNSPYPIKFNTELKLKIRTRDNFICCLCGRTEREELEELNRLLCVNHIDFDKNNCEEKNLNTLCLRCNVKINRNREYWTDYFNQEFLPLETPS